MRIKQVYSFSLRPETVSRAQDAINRVVASEDLRTAYLPRTPEPAAPFVLPPRLVEVEAEIAAGRFALCEADYAELRQMLPAEPAPTASKYTRPSRRSVMLLKAKGVEFLACADIYDKPKHPVRERIRELVAIRAKELRDTKKLLKKTVTANRRDSSIGLSAAVEAALTYWSSRIEESANAATESVAGPKSNARKTKGKPVNGTACQDVAA